MSQKLVNHNPDLGRLVEKGYAVAFDSGHLIVRDIPYLNAGLDLCIGAFVTVMEFVDAQHVRQNDHQVYFAGDVPHSLDGTPIQNLGGGPANLVLSDRCRDVVVQRSFSNKPSSGAFADFFAKIDSYTAIISGPAMEKYSKSPLTRRTMADDETPSVFKFPDTLTSRAGIGALSKRLEEDVIAIIGLGGTGSYILDFLVKTPVREIRGFDNDIYCVHNAFRSPGHLDPNELGMPKAQVYARRYDNFRKNLRLEQKFIDASTADALDGVTFAFVCVDSGSSRAEIFQLLIDRGIPFIDVGMGLNDKFGALRGMMRVTYFSGEDAHRVREEGHAELADRDEDLYRRNTQISELNAANASLAMMKYKQLRGFYDAVDPAYHYLLDIADLKIVPHATANAL